MSIGKCLSSFDGLTVPGCENSGTKKSWVNNREVYRMSLDVNPRARELNIAYIGGGSRGWAWGFMMDLAMDDAMCGTVRLYDIDRSAAERNRIIGSKISAHPDAVSRWEYEVSDSLKDALTDADFIVISILPGTFEEMRSDVHLPERVGVYQPVGDTVGAGGFMRAMRTIPMYVTIAEAIHDYAPDAWSSTIPIRCPCASGRCMKFSLLSKLSAVVMKCSEHSGCCAPC